VPAVKERLVEMLESAPEKEKPPVPEPDSHVLPPSRKKK
jgi:hypothetical protein